MDRTTKRTAAQERLRGGFLAQLGPAIADLGKLVAEAGDDARDSLLAEVFRIAQTAGALGLTEVAGPVGAAAERVAAGQDLQAALDSVASALRVALPAPRFPPVGVVGDEALCAAFAAARVHTAEPIAVAASVDELRRPDATQRWSALLVPVADVAAARAVAEGAPVHAWADDRDWSARLAAVRAGADGFIARDAAVAGLLERVRAAAGRSSGSVEVFVLAEPTDERDALVDAFFDAKFTAVASENPAEIAPALDAVCPDAVVLGAAVAGVPAADLVRAVRSHALGEGVPVIVVGEALDERALRDAGADDVLGADVDHGVVVERVGHRHARARVSARGLNPVSGALDRASVLRELDARLAHVTRSAQPLTVAILHLDGLTQARERWGKAAANSAQRHVVHGLAQGLRRLDLVGQLGDDAFLVALHGCPERVGRRRIADIARKIELRFQGDQRLREVLCLFGVACTERGGTERVVQRAEAELLSVKTTP